MRVDRRSTSPRRCWPSPRPLSGGGHGFAARHARARPRAAVSAASSPGTASLHLTREDQRAMFPVFARHLGPAARCSSPPGRATARRSARWTGQPVYHASLSPRGLRGAAGGERSLDRSAARYCAEIARFARVATRSGWRPARRPRPAVGGRSRSRWHNARALARVRQNTNRTGKTRAGRGRQMGKGSSR